MCIYMCIYLHIDNLYTQNANSISEGTIISNFLLEYVVFLLKLFPIRYFLLDRAGLVEAGGHPHHQGLGGRGRLGPVQGIGNIITIFDTIFTKSIFSIYIYIYEVINTILSTCHLI